MSPLALENLPATPNDVPEDVIASVAIPNKGRIATWEVVARIGSIQSDIRSLAEQLGKLMDCISPPPAEDILRDMSELAARLYRNVGVLRGSNK